MRFLATLALSAALAGAGLSCANAQVPAPAKPMAAPAAPAAKPATQLLDINSAGTAELEALPGIGKARSEAIVKGRPYNGKDDLLNKGIVPANVYADIKDRIVARQATRH